MKVGTTTLSYAALGFGIDPSPRLLVIARQRAAAVGIHADLLLGPATAIPLADKR